MMARRVLVAATTLLTLGVLVAGVSVAWAGGPTRCEGPEGAITIKGNDIAGPGCDLSGTTVEGNVTVEPGGSLKTKGKTETTITGNVQSNNATEIVLLAGGEIGGNVQIQGTTGESFLENSKVRRNVTIQNSVASRLELNLEAVGGNVQLMNNTGSGSKVHVGVFRSSVGGNVLVGNNTLIGTISNEVGIFGNETNSSHTGSIAGNAQVYNNSAAGGSESNEVFAESDQVGVNLEVSNNTSDGPVGSLNAVEVGANTIRNNLLCQTNKPPPTDTREGENHAKKKTGQCEQL
jgi:hypothetical protein